MTTRPVSERKINTVKRYLIIFHTFASAYRDTISNTFQFTILMIHTNPNYVNGDDLTIGEYFRRLIRDDRFTYTSVWNWWQKTTLYMCVPLGIAGFALFASIIYQELVNDRDIDWLLTIFCSLLPFIFIMPFIWIYTYCISFISTRKTEQKIKDFIARYIPDANNITRYNVTNYTLQRGAYEYEVCYSVAPETNSIGRIRKHEYFLVVLHYEPEPGTEFRWMDKYGHLNFDFIDSWDDYCNGKESCRHLLLTETSMSAIFKRKELSSDREVTDAMNQLQYLLKRFNCFSLFTASSCEGIIRNWLSSIDRPTPPDISSIHIRMFESLNSNYMLSLTGSRHYDETSVCPVYTDDFIPEQKYTDIYVEGMEDMELDDIITTVTNAISQYVNLKSEDTSSLFYHKTITVDFEEGDSIRI